MVQSAGEGFMEGIVDWDSASTGNTSIVQVRSDSALGSGSDDDLSNTTYFDSETKEDENSDSASTGVLPGISTGNESDSSTDVFDDASDKSYDPDDFLSKSNDVPQINFSSRGDLQSKLKTENETLKVFNDHLTQENNTLYQKLDVWKKLIKKVEDRGQRQIESLEHKIEEITHKLSYEKDILYTEKLGLEEENRDLKIQINKMKDENKSLKDQITLLEGQIKTLTGEKTSMQVRINFLEGQIKTLNKGPTQGPTKGPTQPPTKGKKKK
jgi:hypothetical protein